MQDDVPSVGSCGQLHKVVQRAEVSIHAFLDHVVGRVTTPLGVAGHLLIQPLTLNEPVIAKKIIPCIGNNHNCRA